MSPLIATSGTESIAAVSTPVTALVMPGTDVQQHDTGLAGRAGVAVGRVRRRLLVPGDDEPDVAAPHRVQQRDVGVAAQAEDVLDAVRLELGDHRLRRGDRVVPRAGVRELVEAHRVVPS